MSSEGWDALTIREVERTFAGAPFTWWIAGGQALDLYVGHALRPHADLDVQVLRDAERSLPDVLAGWELCSARDGELTPWRAGTGATAIWCRPTPASPWALELLVADTDGDGTRWLYRRDRRISRAVDELGHRTADGIPYLRPEIQLLFKSKRPRPKDEADVAEVMPRLDAAARGWLRDALALIDAQHPWLPQLER